MEKNCVSPCKENFAQVLVIPRIQQSNENVPETGLEKKKKKQLEINFQALHLNLEFLKPLFLSSKPI
jgi:hypothetical protein